MGVVKAECKPTQNAEIETVSVKCASGVGYWFGSASIAVIRPNPFFRPYVIPCHPKPNHLTVSENAQIRFILRFILLFSWKLCHSILQGEPDCRMRIEVVTGWPMRKWKTYCHPQPPRCRNGELRRPTVGEVFDWDIRIKNMVVSALSEINELPL